MPSEKLGKYTLLEKLATGGMAEIFLSEQSGPGGFKKRLVIKRILPHLIADEKFLQMFQDEARLAAMMNHPNIVQLFDLGEEEDTYYIAMEYVAGRNLRSVIQISNESGNWLAPEYIAKIGSQICEGLEYAHNFCDAEGNHLNIIHRDVSPQNLILSMQGMIKIVDFGIAKAKSNAQETQAGIIKGKLAYMSPEQVKGQVLDRRSDVFSLGIVMYELATHQRPFFGKSDIEMLRSILDKPPSPIDQIRHEFPPEMCRIIYRALAKNREERYQSAREMQWDLERFLQSYGKPIGVFQLQELVRKLDALDEGGTFDDTTDPPSQSSAPHPPPPAPKSPPSPPTARGPAMPPPPPPQERLPSPIDVVQDVKQPASADDFSDEETAWAGDLNNHPPSLHPPVVRHNAPTAQAGAYGGAYHTPAPHYDQQVSDYAAPPPGSANLSGPLDEDLDGWEDNDATILSVPPTGHSPNDASSYGAAYGGSPPPGMGENDLNTYADPNLGSATYEPTIAESEAVPEEIARHYYSTNAPTVIPESSSAPTVMEQPLPAHITGRSEKSNGPGWGENQMPPSPGSSSYLPPSYNNYMPQDDDDEAKTMMASSSSPHPRRKKTGLIIGIVTGALVGLAFLVALFFFLQ